MDITLNGIKRSGLVIFDRVPNIVEFTGLGGTGSGAQLGIRLSAVTPADGYVLTINGETVTSVVSQSDASARQFGTDCSNVGLANNICRALRSIPSLVSSYSITFTNTGYVILDAYGKGSSTEITYSSDIPDVEFEYIAPTAAASVAEANLVVSRSNPSVTAYLRKVPVGDTCRFDLTPALASMADEWESVPVTVSSYVSDPDGDVTSLYTFNENLVMGHHTKGQPDFTTNPFIAQNMKGGAPDRDVYNSVVLYALQGSDVFVPWCNGSAGTVTVSYAVYDSAFGTVSSGTASATFTAGGISGFTVPSSATTSSDAWYLSVTMPDDSVVRYNLIRSGMSSSCVRIWWRNSMGGKSFFDFTGERSEKIGVSSEFMYDEGSSYGY